MEIKLIKLSQNTTTYTRDEDQIADCGHISDSFNHLPRLGAHPSDTLEDFFDRDKKIAANMLDIVAAHPNSETFVQDYLRKETKGLGVTGKQVPDCLLAVERTVPQNHLA